MEFTGLDVEKTLKQLTLQEKILLSSGLDTNHTNPVHRLGIPSLRITDGPNGVRGTKFFDSVPASCFPTGNALACCWNVPLMKRLGVMMGEQSRAKGVHIIMGPTMNMVRSPLSGRSFECMSEDPILTGELATAYLQGIRSENIMVCPKHLICNDKEDQRMTMNVRVRDRALREIYLLPFMMIEKNAKPETYMTAYNRLNGKHCSENKYLLQDIVRGEWGFDGCFISDWYGVVSCADSVNAGLNLEMPGPSIWRGKHLDMSVFHHTVTMEALDNVVRGILTLVDRASKTGIPENAHEGMKDDKETSALVLEAARESVVLLKNPKNILPLDKKKKVLVIGDSAKKANFASGGCAYVRPYREISLYDALVDNLGEENVEYSVGATNRKLLPSFAHFATSGLKLPIKFCVYDDPYSVKDRKPITTSMVEEIDAILGDFEPQRLRNPNQLYAHFSVAIEVPESAIYVINLKVSGIARLYINGKLELVNDLEHKTSSAFDVDAPELFKEIHLEAKKEYLVEIDFESTLGKSSFINSYGSVVSGIEKLVDQKKTIKEAAALAKDYDQVIVISGLSKDHESEGVDRTSMDLPAYQDLLIESVLDSNPNTVVIIESGTAVSMPWLDKAQAVLHSGFLGEQLGNALFDILFGLYNPSGKLSYTWPKRYEDCSSATSFDLDNAFNLTYHDDIYMGYRHMDKSNIIPLFAFGHGLSYTDFRYENLEVKVEKDVLRVSVDVKNVGDKSGSAVVQAYVLPLTSSVPCPVKGLKGFDKVFCEPGSVVKSSFTINKKLACSFFDEDISKWTLEQGTYELAVGSASDKLEVTERFEIEESSNWIFL